MNALVKNIDLSGGFSSNPVLTKGDGSPVVYLHGLLGQEWNGLLDDLAQRHRVYAPAHAGSGEAEELNKLDGIYDLVIYYDDLFSELGLNQIDLVGHSFGGMMAAEYAAAYPHRVRRLVLIDPLGLWRDDAPVEDYLMISPEKRVELLLGDISNEEVQAKVAMPEDPKERIAAHLQRVTALAAVSHFIWPIPERGLAKRIHRIAAETLILWGADDKLVPPIYAQDFARQIRSSRLEIIPKAGHAPHLQQRQLVAEKIQSFLD